MIQEDFEQHVVKLQNALLGFAKSLTHNERPIARNIA